MLSFIKAYKKFDPAAKSSLEIALLYPGVRAVVLHRAAHWLYGLRLYFLARAVSEFARTTTGTEIHPGAQLGKHVIIEHGFGVVIGETAIVGNNVIILQGVVLGVRDAVRSHAGRRHPTIGDGAILCSGAKILGPIHVGRGARIGANAVVLSDIPDHATAVGIPAVIVSCKLKAAA